MEKIKDAITAETEARQFWREVYTAKLGGMGMGYGPGFSPQQHQIAKDNADLAYEVYMASFAKLISSVKTGT